MMGLRLMLGQIQRRPKRAGGSREGYVRPELQDLAVLADLLDDPAFASPAKLERLVARLMGADAGAAAELPVGMAHDIRRARRFRQGAAE